MKRSLGIFAATVMTVALVMTAFAGATMASKKATEGCTPGYWKVQQHFDSWTGYATGADFNNTFGVGNPDMGSLLDALWAGGDSGGYGQLAFHGVAALLNASHPEVSIGWTPAQVIGVVSGAWGGTKADRIAAKNVLAARNELGCPLN